MSHVRTSIRAAVAAALTGLATTGSRVYQSRMRPVGDGQMPCLLITTNDERIEATTTTSGPQDRLLEVAVRGFAMGATVDATLDQIALEVETAMPANYVLRQISVDFDEELEKPVGSITLIFEVLYFTPAGNPGVSA